MMKINFETPDKIQEKANQFLTQYHPTLSLPVPIEEIISLDLGMDIIPIHGLKTALEKTGLDIDGFYSHNDDSISIDKFISEKRERRFRFTLAHELGHKFLHEYAYDDIRIRLMKEYVDFLNTMSEIEREKAEWQAFEFARRILIPQDVLVDEFTKGITAMEEATELVYDENHVEVVNYAIKYYLTDKFNVSEIPIRIRLESEGLIKKRGESI